ncbi:MAG: PQ-loop domain-containing transporter [Nanoarchaeota archaeon]
MSIGNKILHHLHLRKRLHKNLEPYPHPEAGKNFLDKMIYFVAILGPIMTIPQVLKIWITQNAGGLSLISWTTYFFTGIIWLIYATIHKEKPLVFMYIFWLVIYVFVIWGIIMYG